MLQVSKALQVTLMALFSEQQFLLCSRIRLAVSYWTVTLNRMITGTRSMLHSLVTAKYLRANGHSRGLQATSNFDGAAKNFFKQCADAGLDFCAVAEVVDNKAKSGEELRTTYDSFLAKLTKDFSGNEDKNFIARNAFFDKLYF